MSKHVPPSRKRYEARNPNISLRIPVDLKRKMDALRRDQGITGADLVKKALDAEAPLLEKTRAAAYKQGFDAAIERYATVYRCVGCKKQMYMEGKAMFPRVAAWLEGEEYGHPACVMRLNEADAQ